MMNICLNIPYIENYAAASSYHRYFGCPALEGTAVEQCDAAANGEQSCFDHDRANELLVGISASSH